jgi:hypothetical protein
MRSAARVALSFLLLVGLAACGSESSDTARVEPMGPGAVREPASRSLVDVPAIADIRFVPERPMAGRTVQAQVTLARPEGRKIEDHDVELSFVWTLDGQDLPGVGRSVDLSGAQPGGRLQVTVTPRVAQSDGTPVSHAVRLVDPPPRVVGVSFAPAHGLTANASVQARPIVEDADIRRTSHRFQWIVNGNRQSADEAEFSTDGLRRGDAIQVEVVAYTAGSTSQPYLSDTIVLENAPPVLVPRPLDLDESGGVDTRLEAVDPDGDAPLRFSLIGGPEGLAVSQSGRLTWPDAHTRPGHHVVELSIRDGHGAERKSRFAVDVGSPAAPTR